MLARFITGDASIESDWDEYIATLNNMGLPELQRIIEDVYNVISSK
jgi:putative aldouronate transport system substrate-binding protein